MNLAEIIVRAKTIVLNKGGNPDARVLDGTMGAEAIYPHALRYNIRKALASGSEQLNNFIKEHDVEVIDGVGSLADSVLREHLEHSFLTDYVNAAKVPYHDYLRSAGLSNLITRYAINNNFLYYAGAFPAVLESPDIAVTLNTQAVEHNGDIDFAPFVGHRIKMLDENSGALVINAIIDSVVDSTHFNLRGRGISTSPGGLGVYSPATIYDTERDVVSRSLTGVTTIANSVVVQCAGGAFTAADLGRRIRIMDGSTVVADAIITEVTSGTNITIGTRALSSHAAITADVMYPSLKLQAPTVPAPPATSTATITISPKLAEDVIVTIAACLLGEIPVGSLMN
jgi:hypothetical protein